MNDFLFELLGTFVLVVIDGLIVTNLITQKKLSQPLAALSAFVGVTLGVTLAALVTGGHINPMFTLGMWVAGNITLTTALLFISGQLLGGFLGAFVVVLYGRQSRLASGESEQVNALAGTPTQPNLVHDFSTSIVASTFFAGFITLVINSHLGALTPTFVGLSVAASVLAFGGVSGAALNPARDLGPRLVAKLIGYKNVSLVYGLVVSLGSLLGGVIGVSVIQYLVNLAA